jgi:predicted ArsR family transcriptional regulator
VRLSSRTTHFAENPLPRPDKLAERAEKLANQRVKLGYAPEKRQIGAINSREVPRNARFAS